MWHQGDLYRSKNNENTNVYPRHEYGIYSTESKSLNFELNTQNGKVVKKDSKAPDNVSRILQKVDTMKLDDQKDENKNERTCRRKLELIEVRTAVHVIKNVIIFTILNYTYEEHLPGRWYLCILVLVRDFCVS
jgi:hypothetical protein